MQNAAYYNVPIDVGEEITVPATKTVSGSVAAGMAILAAFCLKYKDERRHADVAFFEFRSLFLLREQCSNSCLAGDPESLCGWLRYGFGCGS